MRVRVDTAGRQPYLLWLIIDVQYQIHSNVVRFSNLSISCTWYVNRCSNLTRLAPSLLSAFFYLLEPSNPRLCSGCGWPAFDKCFKGSVVTETDNAYGMRRVEIMCSQCGGHLGHVVSDSSCYCLTANRYYCYQILVLARWVWQLTRNRPTTPIPLIGAA